MSHPFAIYSFAQTTFLVNAHYNELLVWFKASDFWHKVNTRPSLRLLSDILLLPWLMEILCLWFHRPRSFICSNRWYGTDVGVCKVKVGWWVWVVSRLKIPVLHQNTLPMRASSPLKGGASSLVETAGGACLQLTTISSPASLHSIRTSLFLFLSYLSTTYLISHFSGAQLASFCPSLRNVNLNHR